MLRERCRHASRPARLAEGEHEMLPSSAGAVVEGQDLLTLDPQTTVGDAAKQMADRGIGAVPVIEDDRLVGIFSERDLLQRVAAAGRDFDRTRLAEVMTAEPVTVDASIAVAKALEVMQDGGFRHLPVMRAGQPIGIMSMRDIPAEYLIMRQNWVAARQTNGRDPNTPAPKP